MEANNLLISNVEKHMIAALKQRAKDNNRSVSGEIRAMLNEYLNAPNANAGSNAMAIAMKWQNKLADRSMPASIDLISEEKEERDYRTQKHMGFHENPQAPFDAGEKKD